MQQKSRSGAKWMLFIATLALIVLHQDWWNWDKVDPRLLGFLPIGLGYHVVYTIACAVLMLCFVLFLWPRDLEDVQRPDQEKH